MAGKINIEQLQIWLDKTPSKVLDALKGKKNLTASVLFLQGEAHRLLGSFQPAIATYAKALKAHISLQTPHPTQSVLSTRAFPSLMEIAGQPSFMQDLHPTHLSVSTLRGGFFSTFFSSTQGLLEMITEGSFASSSSLTACSHSARL